MPIVDFSLNGKVTLVTGGAIFFASDAGSFATGSTMVLDGGSSA